MKAAFYTLGCKVNQYETQLMSEHLKNAGYEIVDYTEKADVYVVNSCTVTAVSNAKTRQAVRNFKKRNKNGIVILAGCMSQAYPDIARELEQADIVIGNTSHKELVRLIEKFKNEKNRVINICPHTSQEEFEDAEVHNFFHKTRAILKIEDGCNRFCSYCAIPYARGRVRSKSTEKIKAESAALAEAGYSEIVVVGINLSAYNYNGSDMADAVKIIAENEKIKRVRLGSLEPDHITDEIISKLKKEPKFCPQFHISLQSGCNKTLKNMNRHYTAEEYKALCDRLRTEFEGCTLTTDVMTGFPGESEEDFICSYGFVKEIGFEKLHVFPYSVREGTAAAKMKGQIDKKTKTERCKKMIALGEEIRQSFFEKQNGKTYDVLFEKKHEDGMFYGYTKNYIPVKVFSEDDLTGKIKPVMITGCDKECTGKICD